MALNECFDLPKVRLEMAGIGNEGSAYQLQCAILDVHPTILAVENLDPWQSCRHLEPLSAHGAQSAPCQKSAHS